MKAIHVSAALVIMSPLVTRSGVRAWAQAPVDRVMPVNEPSSAWSAAPVVIVVIALLLIFSALVKVIDFRRKRENEALVVQARISDAILRDPTLFGLPVTPTARVPLWRGSPVTVEVTGLVPSDELRHAVLRLVEQEALRVRGDVRIESRISVVAKMTQSAA